MRFSRQFKTVLGVAVALTATVAASPAMADRVASNENMYNQRYCEYLFVHMGSSGLYADVWNTFGLNRCPAKQWDATDKAGITTEMGALVTKMNGPRYWLIDSAQITFNTSTNPPQGSVRSFGGLKMRLLTTVDVPVVNGAPGMPSYTETIVNRKTHFTFSRRKPLRMLVAPNGNRYAMQAYSQIKDPTLRESQINGLGSRLALPAGWSFKVTKLRKDLTLRTSGRTTVVQDELENTYQLIR